MNSDESDPMAALAANIARAIRLPIDPAHLPGVGRNLALLYEHAAKMQAVELPAGQHQAPIYRP